MSGIPRGHHPILDEWCRAGGRTLMVKEILAHREGGGGAGGVMEAAAVGGHPGLGRGLGSLPGLGGVERGGG